MYLAIDNRPVIRQPHTIEIVPYDPASGFTGDGTPTVKDSGNYVTLNCTFGQDLSYQDVMAELDRRRANRGVHTITFDPLRGCQLLTVNAFMGKPRVTHVGYDNHGKIITSAFTVPFIQVPTTTFLYALRFRLDGIISALSPYTFREPPAAGRIIAVEGSIRDLGAGGGQTRVQLYNNAMSVVNYLSTPGDFVCGSSGGAEIAESSAGDESGLRRGREDLCQRDADSAGRHVERRPNNCLVLDLPP